MNISRYIRSIIVFVILVGASSALSAQQRIVFATSATGNADLGSWPEAGDGPTGLSAADAICVNQATSGGLNNPENFVAWISDDVDDAYCRVHNLTGKKADNCGQENLPVAAGPWVRSDGAPAAGTIDQLLVPNPVVYMPLLTDESGDPVALDQKAWSATRNTGIAYTDTCSNWTNGTSDSSVSLQLQGNSWGSNGGSPCDSPDLHLVCVETGVGAALELPMPVGNIAFHTSADGTGNLSTWNEAADGTSGIEAGDSICNNLAADSGLPWQGNYKAWLSDDSVIAPDRFNSDGPWYRPDGIQIAESKADLIDGSVFSAIVQSESGGYRAFQLVWTGTNADGSLNINNCNGWESEIGMGSLGRASDSNAAWTQSGQLSCDQTSFRIYCLSDVAGILSLEDGFEDP